VKKFYIINLRDHEQLKYFVEQIKVPLIEEDCVLIAAKNNRKLDDLNRNLIQIRLTAVNKYDLLHNLNGEEKSTNMVIKDLRTRNISNYSQIKKRVKNVESQRAHKHKVWIIGDSQVRKCAAELRQTLDRRYEVMGFTKPGAQTSDIIKMVEEEIATFSSKDFFILWAGANYISKNNTKGALKSLTKFMKVYKRANIVLINTPHRHDLLSTSCVNKKVVKFNRQLKKIIKLNTNVDLIEVELQRKHFTRHGQHLNHSGKEFLLSWQIKLNRN
jgi:hypothetical protein